MGYVNCPHCTKRLRTPDSDKPLVLRCPWCKNIFRANGNGQPAVGPGSDDTQTHMALDGISADDEAMLRDLGSGSGLLELTREAVGLSVPPRKEGDKPRPPVSETAVKESAARASAVKEAVARAEGGQDAAPVSVQLERQFQIVGTALALSNKLVQAHKAELIRTQRSSRLGWSAVAVLVVLGAIALWWATSQTGQVSLERQNGLNLTGRLADRELQLGEARERMPKLTSDLDTARSELVKVRSELASARESMAESKASIQILTNDLDTVKTKHSELTAELERVKGIAKPSTQPAVITRRDGITE